jgi:hypothetical protein
MSKYDPLSDRLAGHSGPEWRASFAELEEVLGFPLPKAARGRTWWKPQAGSHARAWTDAGWSAHEVDPTAGQVLFRRQDQSPLLAPAVAEGPLPTPPAAAAPGDEPAIVKDLERPKWHMALLAGGLAVVAGGAALALRGLMRRGEKG